VVPVWREVLADFETPLSAFVKLWGIARVSARVGRARGTWGRFSFLGRDPALTLVVRGNRVEFGRRARSRRIPTDSDSSPRWKRWLKRYRAPVIPEPTVPWRRRRLAGLRHRPRDRTAANVPPDDQGLPDAVLCPPSGRRVRSLPAAAVPDRERVSDPGCGAPPARRGVRRACARLADAVATSRPAAVPAVAPPGEDLSALPESPAYVTGAVRRCRWRPRASTSSPGHLQVCWRNASTSSAITTRSRRTGCCGS